VASRPTSVTVIGWLTVGVGVASILSAAGALLVTSAMPPFTPEPDTSGIYFPNWPFEHMVALSICQVGVASIALISGAGLLRLRAWARTTVEVLAWASLVGLVAFGVVWLRTATSMTSHLPKDAGVPNLGPVFVAGGVVAMIMFVIPTLVVIRVLRTATVRAAVQPGPDEATKTAGA
jgi:hypothetical protein